MGPSLPVDRGPEKLDPDMPGRAAGDPAGRMTALEIARPLFVILVQSSAVPIAIRLGDLPGSRQMPGRGSQPFGLMFHQVAEDQPERGEQDGVAGQGGDAKFP